MSRADCDLCDEYRSKERRDLRIYKEASEAANRIIESQLKQIATLKAALISERAYMCSANVIETMPMDNGFVRMAKDQLAKEYPEIFAEE